MQTGDTWEINFKANGLDCILVKTVKEAGISKDVEGKTYENVFCVEGENRIVMNGNMMPFNFFTRYYYADKVGLILTTASASDSHALTICILN